MCLEYNQVISTTVNLRLIVQADSPSSFVSHFILTYPQPDINSW